MTDLIRLTLFFKAVPVQVLAIEDCSVDRYVCVCVCVCVHARAHVFMCMCACACVRVCVRACLRVRARARVCVYFSFFKTFLNRK